MSLKQRLSLLRQQSGHQTRPTVLAERIQRLRPQTAPTSTEKVTGHAESLAELVGGEVLAPGLIVKDRRVPLTDHHGTFCLEHLHDRPESLPEAEGLDPARAVFLDTETTGLSGGTGTAVFMLGLARLDGEALLVRQYLLSAFSGEPAMLQSAAEWLCGAGSLVSFNGKCFDMPLLSARCRLAGVDDPFAGRPHLDLLHPLRRAYGQRWDNCRLQTAERRLLGFIREDDLPGAEAPPAWFDFIHRGDGKRLPAVAEHNHWDLVSLAALLPALADVHAEPAAWDADVCAIARVHLRNGDHTQALSLLQANAAVLEEAGLLELARLHRRRGEWRQACEIWESLAEQGCPEAVEGLAKYHEHVRKDYDAALDYAARLPTQQRRLRRIERKRGGTARLAF